jgi:hypothetical protein
MEGGDPGGIVVWTAEVIQRANAQPKVKQS